jgi:hypothetical protein
MKRTASLLLLGVGLFAALTAVLVRSDGQSTGITWPIAALSLVGVVAWVWWRTSSVASRTVANSVAEFGAVSGVNCRLVNDRVDQFGSLVVGHDGISWNPNERAVRAGCNVWRAPTSEIDSVKAGRTRSRELPRRVSAITITPKAGPVLYVALPAKAQRAFMASAASMGLPTWSDES